MPASDDFMNVTQRLLKLRKMSPREIRVRAGEHLARRRERGRWRRGANGAAQARVVPGAEGHLLESARRLVPGTGPGEIERLKEHHPHVFEMLASRASATAEAVLSGRWELLGHPVDLRGPIDWHRDPRGGHRWARAFYADLSRAGHGGPGVDVKYVWELARHQYLVELARGWLFTREDRFARRAREVLLDWIAENPLYEGIHWTSALEAAMRAIAWLWTLASAAEWDGWQADDLRTVAASLADHAAYLERHLSYYSSPYNHLIGEATGLYLIGTALGEPAGRWRGLGLRVLAEHGPRQFYGDGFCVEQATGYHFYTLGFLSMAIAAARTQGEPLAEVERSARRAYRAGAAFRQPDGRWPAIGDVDSARSIPVHHDDFWDFNSLCCLGAVLFGDGTLKTPGTPVGEEVYWLLGSEGVESWNRLPAEGPAACTVLDESGYAIARRGGDWLLFDAGPLGDGLHADATPSTAHGHADSLEVLFGMGGKEILRDGGMPFYFGASDWVRHFRSPAAHNTIEIEGAAMARHAGPLEWSHVAPRPRLDADLSDDVWLARARAEWAPGVVVERHLLGLPGKGLWIADWIETDRPRRVRWYWQVPSGAFDRVDELGGTLRVFGGDGIFLAAWSTSGPIRARIEAPQADAPAAWHAPGYGLCREGQRIVHEAETARELLVVTYLGGSPMPVEVAVGAGRLVCVHDDRDALPDLEPIAVEAQHAGLVWRVPADCGLPTLQPTHPECQPTP